MALIDGVTTDDVLALTGKTVSADVLAQAVAIIELYARVDLSNFAAFNASNRKWLQAAVCYQSAWMLSQVEMFGRSDFVSQGQDGLSLTTRSVDSITLAPLAWKALSSVSWVRPRTIMIAPGRYSDINTTSSTGWQAI